LTTFFASFRSRAALQLEILTLRHQLGVLQRSVKRPKLTPADRLLWAWLSAVWNDWQSSVFIIKASTVIGWQRQGFRLFWAWKVRRGRPGRPGVPQEVRRLIRTMSRENPLWGAPRIHGELLKLGVDISETSVSKYLVRRHNPPSQTWRTFLDNHVKSMVSVDFFTVPTIRFQMRYVFLVLLAHERRRILHFGVTACPTAEWTAQQLREAFPWETAPRYLLRDRDRIFGTDFVKQVKAMGIKQVLAAPRSPWQRLHRARHRDHSARVPGSRDRMERSRLVSPSAKIRRLLSPESHAPGLAEGHARVTTRPSARSRADRRDPRGGRAPSSLRASRRLNRVHRSS
jgi:hypothetical protein